jgi:hypothetical protein
LTPKASVENLALLQQGRGQFAFTLEDSLRLGWRRGSRLQDQARWKPQRPAMPEVILGNSGAAGEWRLCADGKCRTLSSIFGHPIGAEATTMRVCQQK